MGFGLPPKHAEEIRFDDATTEQFLGAAVTAVQRLGWSLSELTDSTLVAFTGASIASMGEEIRITAGDGLAGIESRVSGSQIFDWGKNRKNTDRFIDACNEILSSSGPESLVTAFRETAASLQQPAFPAGRASDPGEPLAGGFLSVFVPRTGFLVTPIIVDLNIAVFILMALSGVGILQPENADILAWGGNYRPATMDGEGWRLLTSCFLHIGVIHLVMNMYALVFIGMLLEPLLGRAKYSAAYLLSGLLASTASLYWNETSVSAGASGAIFGLYGVFLALLSTNLIERERRKALWRSIGLFVLYNLASGLSSPVVDNAAHLGGLGSGLLIGFAFVPLLQPNALAAREKLTLGLLAGGCLACSVAVLNQRPGDLATYELTMNDFAGLERSAMSWQKLAQENRWEEAAAEISLREIPNWNSAIQLLRSTDTLTLPDWIVLRNREIIRYCSLRITMAELTLQSIEGGTNSHDDQLDSCEREIRMLISRLSAVETPDQDR